MKIIITGANGFVGSHLVKYFKRKGHEIYAFGRQKKPAKALMDIADYRCFDMEDSNTIEISEADVCIHAAALTDTQASIQNHIRLNVVGTKNLLKAIKVNHFIYISSSSVYAPGLFVREADANNNDEYLSNYGKAKFQTEQYLQNVLNEKTEFKTLTIFRPRAVYGNGDRQLLARLLHLLKYSYFVWPGNKNCISSMTHIGNLCYACDLAIQKSHEGSSVYNVCDRGEYQLYHTVKTLLETLGKTKLKTFALPCKLLIPAAKLLHGNNGKYYELQQLNASFTLDQSKLISELGYEAIHTFSPREIGDWYNEKNAENVPIEEWPWL